MSGGESDAHLYTTEAGRSSPGVLTGGGMDIDRPLPSELERGGGGWGRLSRSSAGTCTTKKTADRFCLQ